MDCKPSIVFYHFTGYLDRIFENMLLNLHTFNELISVLCAISFGALPQVSYHINDLHV